MPGTLYVVATPIGNLEDISLRALRVLREVRTIAAEDTRRTARLLAHYSIGTPTISFHEHNTRGRLPQLISRLQAGQDIALVTDAGTPGISDPGVALVTACVSSGIPVDSIPGPSAPITAAAISGFALEPMTVLGFVPSRASDRKRWLTRVQTLPHTLVFFETPHRVHQTLKELALYFGERPIVVARELTKAHQELRRGTISQVAAHLPEPKGEYTLVIGPVPTAPVQRSACSDADLADEFCYTTNVAGVSRREALKSVARKHGRATREVYAAVVRGKKLVK